MCSFTDARRARAFLQHAAEPTNPILARYVAEVGPVDAAHHVSERTAPADALAETRPGANWMLAEASLRTAAQLGARFVIPEDDECPAAALTSATVVAEAGMRNGARNVARWAAALGRPVLALPGPVTSAASTGCHQLIQDGTARLVTSTDGILDAIDEDAETDGEPEAAASADEAGRG